MPRTAKTDAPRTTPPAAPRKMGRPPAATAKARISFYVDESLIERARNAAYWASPRLALNGLAERGLELALREVEKRNGGPFPARKGDL